MPHPKPFAVLAATLLVVLLGACATDEEVRQTCANHEGVQSVNGNAARKYVSCRDGYFRTVR